MNHANWHINWSSVYTLTLLLVLLKACWYSDFAFGNYIKRIHFKRYDTGHMAGFRVRMYIVGTLVDFGFISMLEVVVHSLGAYSWVDGLLYSLFGFFMMLVVLFALSSQEEDGWYTFPVHAGYLLAACLVMGMGTIVSQ